MLTGRRIAIGPVAPEDLGSLFCWANDVVAARLDTAYRPVDLPSCQSWLESFVNDPTKIMFAIRKVGETSAVDLKFLPNLRRAVQELQIQKPH
jgi:hypothetical protein